jgi:hypothetical protein
MSNDITSRRSDSYRPAYPLPLMPGDTAAYLREREKSPVEMGQTTIYLGASSGPSRVKTYLYAADYVLVPVHRLSEWKKTRARSPELQRILARQPEVIYRARQLRATLGDPIEGLAQVLQDLPVEDDLWSRISQEPYG